MLTVGDIATQLAVSTQCVYSLIDNRLLPASRTSPAGRGIRVRPDDLIEFLEKCKVPRRGPRPLGKTAPAPAAFTELNADRLRKAWAERGIGINGSKKRKDTNS